MPPVSANTRQGQSLLATTRDSTSRASPDLGLMPRRLFTSPDTAEKDADATSYSSDPEEIETLMKRPGPLGRVLPSATAETPLQEDKEFQTLMAELRTSADRILREDEWKYKSSDLILGFRD